MSKFDAVTSLTVEAEAGARLAVRGRPRINWTDDEGGHSAIIESRMVIGNASGADVRVADATVSRLHAELDPRDDGLWIRDLGSRNGTFIDGIRIESARLHEGAAVSLGAARLVLAEPNEPVALDLWPESRYRGLIGAGVAMRALFARLEKIAGTEATVLVQGETGTGKELVARAIHEASPRAPGPFVVVDCGALPEDLLEAELFGHARGAFTGAVASRAGAFEVADGGTVFLDEIGELPLAMQPKLLRVLESQTVRRLGETAQKKVSCRFVSATNRDLRSMVNAGAFREDLYFRLAVVPVAVPPLRERTEDIPLLLEHFLNGRPAVSLDDETRKTLTKRPWLGNVRELRNFVEQAVVLGMQEALSLLAPPVRPSTPGLPPVSADRPFKVLREEWLNHLERGYISALLENHQGNITAVAEAAGLDRSYVHRLVRKHDL